MQTHTMKHFLRRTGLIAAAVLVASFSFVASVHAAAMTDRSVTLTNEDLSATGVSYAYSFKPATSGNIREIWLVISGAADGSGNSPTGMAFDQGGTSAVTASSGTWSINHSGFTGGSSSKTVKLTSTANVNLTAGSAFTFTITNVRNSSVANTYFTGLTTYSDTPGTVSVDTGVVAFPIRDTSVTVDAKVAETLTFSISSTALDLGFLSIGSVSSANHTMSVATNAANGYSITAQGTTLTYLTNTIPFVTDGTTVDAGTREYGVEFTGSQAQGSGSRDLSTSRTVASSASATAAVNTTATYRASMDATTASGNYQSVINYNATANF